MHKINDTQGYMKHTFYLAYPNAEQSPIMLAIRDKKKRVAISLGIMINPKDWDKDSLRAKRSAKDFKFVNDKILLTEKAVNRAISYGELDDLNIEQVANLYRKEMGMEIKEDKKDDDLFLPFFNMWAHNSFGSHTANRATSYHYRVFKEFLGKLNPTFEEIDYNIYINYLTYLKKKGYKLNMQGGFIRSLKAAMNEAYKRRLHTNVGYLSFVKPAETVTTIALTDEEIEKIYNAKLSGGLEMARDIFLLGCYTGLRFSDYSRLTREEAEKDFITKLQQKTNREVCIPVHPRVKEILLKWNGAPKISQQKVNTYIKSICAQVGITDKVEVRDGGKIEFKEKWEMVSTHTARRTAATNLLLSGASIHEVMMFLGHASVTQTQKYLRISSKENAKMLAKNKFFT